MSKIKEILCMHHSHLDIGYTHPQPMLLELQRDYIDQAIDLCLKTANFPEESKFRWTCEATYPVLKWLETASEERTGQLKRLLRNGQISITALPMHTTPLSNVAQMAYMMKPAAYLRKLFDMPIDIAINHDINGQPWTMSQILLDSGVNFYITGINIHFGGIPFKRPSVFRWETPDKRELLTFLGEHYSLFSQFFYTSEKDTGLMDKGIKEYVNRLEQCGYEQDFVFLTATNPPLYDNNCPDWDLAELIRKYNEEGHEQVVRFVTPEMLRERVLKIKKEDIPVHRGDWTDFWNFGCASSAKETRISRRAKENLRKAELLESFSPSIGEHYDRAKSEAYLNSILYDEHTWGASQSITDPLSEEVYSQRTHKSHMAYKAADLSAYLLGRQVNQLAGNPIQATDPEGVIVVNTSCSRQQVELRIPESLTEKGRYLSAARMKQFLPYAANKENAAYYGTVALPPFSWKKIPFSQLEAQKLALESEGAKKYSVLKDRIETPFYDITFNSATGRIVQIFDRMHQWAMIDEESPWTFFEFVRETIDPLYNPEQRSTFFPRDIDLGNKNISVWNHNWKSRRESALDIKNWHIEEEKDSVSIFMELAARGVVALKQKITFSVLHPRIQMRAYINRENITVPEGIYFAFPMNLEEGWRANFDSAGTFIELDYDQLGNTCRDWVTVDQCVALYDSSKGVVLACPDAPMVQIGDFNFGKESHYIERKKNPLLLAWPINNYWDTNFWISQPGAIELCYEMTPFEKFDPAASYDSGLYAKEPVIIATCVECPKEESRIFFNGNGEGIVPLSIRPSQKGGIIIMLKNLRDADGEYVFSVPGKTIREAYFINIVEEELSQADIIDGQVKVKLSPYELVQIAVSLS